LRGLGAGKINGPGGRIEPNETPEQAVVRELEEEVSVTPLSLSRLGNLKFAFVDGYNLECWVFRADAHTGLAQPSPEAIPLWTPIDQIPYERMWRDDREWFPHLINKRGFAGRFVFDGDTMLSSEVSLHL
jgi:8-oxo-dGTP diphosphatase